MKLQETNEKMVENNVENKKKCTECKNIHCSLQGDERFYDCGRMDLFEKG